MISLLSLQRRPRRSKSPVSSCSAANHTDCEDYSWTDPAHPYLLCVATRSCSARSSGPPGSSRRLHPSPPRPQTTSTRAIRTKPPTPQRAMQPALAPRTASSASTMPQVSEPAHPSPILTQTCTLFRALFCSSFPRDTGTPRSQLRHVPNMGRTVDIGTLPHPLHVWTLHDLSTSTPTSHPPACA